MKKIIAILIAALLVLSLGVCASAAEADGSENASADGAHGGTALPDENAYAGEIFDAILENVSGILSILTFAVSVILTILYKKGLMPTLGGALGSIDSTVRILGERTESGIASAHEAVRRIDGKMDEVGGIIESVSKTLDMIDKRMLELEEKRSDGDSIRVMMRSQVEDLCEMFSSADLSEINRKTVEEKLTVIKAHLEKDQ